MSRPAVNLQDQFLNQARREGLTITIVLLDGSHITCVVKGFDNYTVVVVSETGAEHLLYKHAVAQLVSPRPLASARPPQMREGGPREGGRREGGPPRDSAPRDPNRRPPRPAGAAPTGGRPAAGEAEVAAAPGEKPAEKSGFNKLDLSNIKLESQGGDPGA